MQYLIAALIGLAGGVSSGLFGVGGGIVMVPAMVYLMHTNIKTAIGTSLVVIIPTALTGAFKHQQLGNIDWKVAASLIPMAIIGGFIGAALTKHVPADTLKTLRLHVAAFDFEEALGLLKAHVSTETSSD